MGRKTKRKTFKEFVEDCNIKFKNKFKYVQVEEYKNQKSEIVVICPIHGEIKITASGHYESTHGCRQCFQESQIKSKVYKNCELCGKQMDITAVRNSKQKYCSYECVGKAKDNKVEKVCVVCHKPYKVIDSRKDKSICCSKKCSNEYDKARQLAEHYETRIVSNCEYCGKEIISTPSQIQKYCSIECKHIGEVGKYTMENNPNFKRIKTNCAMCDEEIYVKQHKFEKQQNNFCSDKCRNKHFKEIYTKTEDYSNKRRDLTLKALSDGKFKKVDNEIQRSVNKMLFELGIKFINEKVIFKFALDNFIEDRNLAIEVMGTFWHQDIRFNEQIIYNSRVNNIVKDKAKRTYLNNIGVKVLYLWEYDIENDFELCKNMIKEFYDNNGIIDNYHSFNYKSDTIIIPYMEMVNEDLQNYIHLDVKKERSKRDESKWIKFDCEFCGKPHQQLISKYIKNKTHCCSISCSSKIKSKLRKEGEKENE